MTDKAVNMYFDEKRHMFFFCDWNLVGESSFKFAVTL